MSDKFQDPRDPGDPRNRRVPESSSPTPPLDSITNLRDALEAVTRIDEDVRFIAAKKLHERLVVDLATIRTALSEAEARIAALQQQQETMQPLIRDHDGVVRFKRNAIVAFLLDDGPNDMNRLARLPFTNEDRMQFAQLIGYSVGGYGELHYVSDESYERASAMVAGVSPPEPERPTKEGT